MSRRSPQPNSLAPPVAPFTIDLVAAETPPGGLPQAGETRMVFTNSHLGYAITWYGLAAALAGVFASFAWTRLRGEREQAALDAARARLPNCARMSAKPKCHILLCAPRGFCAGVDRAIQIVEEALERFGAPVYVRHEIVHNRYVVESLKAKGAIFVDELDEIPDTTQPVVFSAHGVPKRVPESAAARNLFVLDATCPLVSKVHKEAILHHAAAARSC